MSPAGTTTQQLGRDLRDVIVRDGHIYVTRFHTAQLVEVATGTTLVPPTVKRNELPMQQGVPMPDPVPQVDAIGSVAWRTIAMPDGSFVMSHQRKRAMQLKVVFGGYTTPCGDGPVESAITQFKPDGTAVAVAPMLHGALVVDVAASPDGSELAFASAGRKAVLVMPQAALATRDDDECGDGGNNAGLQLLDDRLGMPTSVAYAPTGELLIYYPELPALVVHGETTRTIRLPGPFGYDSGRALFHRQTRASLACASCHPEGREDGQVWGIRIRPTSHAKSRRRHSRARAVSLERRHGRHQSTDDRSVRAAHGGLHVDTLRTHLARSIGSIALRRRHHSSAMPTPSRAARRYSTHRSKPAYRVIRART